MAFIGIDRGIVDHWIYKDAEYFKVWFEMLYRARYVKEPKTDMQDGELYTINYGEFMYGRISWSERLGVSEQRLRTLIKRLVQDDMISLVSTYRRFSIYKIKNYEKFNQQSNQQETVDTQGFEPHDNHHDNHPPTIKQPPNNHQATTKEQSKQGNKVTKKGSKTYTPEFDEFWNVYPRKIGKVEAFKTWERNIRNNESPTVMIQCASNYAKDCELKQTAEQYIKHPKTFLNEERYKDFMVIVLSQSKSGYQRTKSKLDQMLAEAEAKQHGTSGYYQTGTDLFG